MKQDFPSNIFILNTSTLYYQHYSWEPKES